MTYHVEYRYSPRGEWFKYCDVSSVEMGIDFVKRYLPLGIESGRVIGPIPTESKYELQFR
jgi:hypothetical protein